MLTEGWQSLQLSKTNSKKDYSPPKDYSDLHCIRVDLELFYLFVLVSGRAYSLLEEEKERHIPTKDYSDLYCMRVDFELHYFCVHLCGRHGRGLGEWWWWLFPRVREFGRMFDSSFPSLRLFFFF